ncbi:MAG: hypothetical protein AB7O67_13825 [Vicinamibacterales bacterium]
MRRIVVTLAALLVSASAGFAQTVVETPPAVPPEPVTIFGAATLAAGGHHTGAGVGGTLTAGVTDRLSLEGQVQWLDRGPGSSAVAALGSVLVRLAPGREDASPYLALGGGMYSAAFDMGMQGMFGGYGWVGGPGVGMGGMGPGFGYGQGTWYGPGGMFGTGPLPWPDHVPAFYRTRMGNLEPPVNGAWDSRRFTDPALSLGGGASLAVGRHLVLRPDVRALVVFGDGRTQTIGLFNLGVGFRF